MSGVTVGVQVREQTSVIQTECGTDMNVTWHRHQIDGLNGYLLTGEAPGIGWLSGHELPDGRAWKDADQFFETEAEALVSTCETKAA